MSAGGSNMQCKHCEAKITAADREIGAIDECRLCAKDVEKYVGHMIWDHKTAPVMEIHASKKSLETLKDGRYNRGLKLIKEVKERSRRREGDGDAKSSGVPFRRGLFNLGRDNEAAITVEVRNGSGRTYTAFSPAAISSARRGEAPPKKMSAEKAAVLQGCSRLAVAASTKGPVEVWQDDQGFYIPKRKVAATKELCRLDAQTLRSLGYRSANYSRR
jgi:hypothetical protein